MPGRRKIAGVYDRIAGKHGGPIPGDRCVSRSPLRGDRRRPGAAATTSRGRRAVCHEFDEVALDVSHCGTHSDPLRAAASGTPFPQGADAERAAATEKSGGFALG